MSWFFQKLADPRLDHYIAGTPRKYSRKTPIDSLRFLVIDTETTGLNVGRDRVLSMALVEMSNGQLNTEKSAEWIFFQPSVTVNESAKVHGILPSDTAHGLPTGAILSELLSWLQGGVIVGHHVAFDAAMLNHAWRQEFKASLRNPLVDTALLAMRTVEAFARTGYANQRPPSLDEVCQHCGVPLTDRHTAMGDAFTTAELFLLLCARRRRQLNRPLVWDDLPKVTF